MDYAAWALRVSTFLRGLTWLPGEVEVTGGIESPISSKYHQDWLRGDRCSLPSELKRFLETASKRCLLRYSWKVPEIAKDPVGRIWAGCDEIIGGGDFCEAASYSVYDGGGVVWRDADEDGDRKQGRIQLVKLDDGSRICLSLEKVGASRPVVHAGPQATDECAVLSESFDHFLQDWENLSYLHPTREILAPWIDPRTGQLNSGSEKSDLLRQVLKTSSREQFENSA